MYKSIYTPSYQLAITNSYTSHYCTIAVYYIEMIDSSPYMAYHK